MRAKIRNAANEISLFVDPQRAKYCHKGLATVQTKKGSTFLEDDSEYQHITTAIGYCVDYIWPVAATNINEHVVPLPTLNRWNNRNG